MGDATAKDPLIPLLYFVQGVLRTIHEIPSDKTSEALTRKSFSPEATIEINQASMDRTGFGEFMQDYRNKYIFVDFAFHDAVTVPTDDEGRSGTVGVGIKARAVGKVDGVLYEARLHEIFQVEWIPSRGDSGGHRLITKLTGALKDLYPVQDDSLCKSML
ncbi:hypothetical protein BO94DRAFT_43999 [Aspergillus sclerotioniger CBS 115572]|uniref:SnoaL-like domain-containing protein n=1 Tax=Aspergillus sclerotioniger CBS 115572 TaxID=1450535 RepID=A0A317WUF5_9EURO|nr:hypothetical protein BO94DRAFT_43999 [Aspergillus sclerotioniger CBS 115572]PWY89705.1 hypothetical protein BO94DRAFT_43999 [Aspergillus sclerotioniger CBS 115572]